MKGLSGFVRVSPGGSFYIIHALQNGRFPVINSKVYHQWFGKKEEDINISCPECEGASTSASGLVSNRKIERKRPYISPSNHSIFKDAWHATYDRVLEGNRFGLRFVVVSLWATHVTEDFRPEIMFDVSRKGLTID